MEAITKLHTQLNSTNAELETLQELTTSLQHRIDQQKVENKDRQQLYSKAKENHTRVTQQLQNSLPEIHTLENQLQMADVELELLQAVYNDLLPNIIQQLDDQKQKQHELKTKIKYQINETIAHEGWIAQVDMIQKQINEIKTEYKEQLAKSNYSKQLNLAHKVEETKNQDPFSEEYIMRCLDMEESEISQILSEIDEYTDKIASLKTQQISSSSSRNHSRNQQTAISFNSPSIYNSKNIYSELVPENSFPYENQEEIDHQEGNNYGEPPLKTAMLQHTMTRTIKYEYQIPYATESTTSTVNNPSNAAAATVPWYKRNKVRSLENNTSFRSGLELLQNEDDETN